MTLYEITNLIKDIALKQPNVRSFRTGSIYEALNASPSVDYTNMTLTQRQHSMEPEDGYYAYKFYLFYTDLEKDDNENRLMIQSEAISALTNVLNSLMDNGITLENVYFDTYAQRFADLCSGAYATFDCLVPIDYTCGYGY